MKIYSLLIFLMVLISCRRQPSDENFLVVMEKLPVIKNTWNANSPGKRDWEQEAKTKFKKYSLLVKAFETQNYFGVINLSTDSVQNVQFTTFDKKGMPIDSLDLFSINWGFTIYPPLSAFSDGTQAASSKTSVSVTADRRIILTDSLIYFKVKSFETPDIIPGTDSLIDVSQEEYFVSNSGKIKKKSKNTTR